MIKNISLKLATVLAFCLCLGFNAFGQAQAGTGSITGVVSDSTGAVVPNATVTLTSKATNQTQTTTTSDEGVYRFVLLRPGIYTVKTSAGNFAEQTLDVEVQVGRATDANFTLGAAGVAAEVLVTAEGIQTTQSNSDAVINEKAISDLPINGRRFQDFVTLTPTAQVDPQRGQISLAGQKGINGNINVDGVDYNQPFFGGIRGGERSNLAFTIPQESIKEFQVVASGYSAEFGRSSGGIVNAVTKSGSNDVRGSAFVLWRPDRLARGYNFTDALAAQRLNALGVSATLAPTQYQWGGSVGGPIIKEKLFYFAAYEQQRFRAPRQIIFGIPSSFTFTLPTGVTDATPYNAVLNFYRGQQTGYQQTNDAFAILGKVDWTINGKNRFNVRYNLSKNNALNAVSRGETSVDPTTNQSIATNGTEKNRNNIVVGQLITSFSSTAINEVRGQWAREDRPRFSNSELPQIFTAWGTFGATAFLPTTQFDTRYQAADAFTWLKGNHTIKLGGEYSRLFASQVFGFNQFGAYSLSIGSTNANINDAIVRLANVVTPLTAPNNVLGRFDDNRARYSKQIGNLQASFAVHELAFFGQDTWRFNSKWSFNYGLRVEQQFNPTPEANNTQVINAVQNTAFPIRGRGYDPTQIPDSGWQWGPRAGFAFDPKGDGKTVIRGYSGLYYARTPLLVFAGSVNNYRTPPGDVSTSLPFTGFSQANFNTFLGTPAGQQYLNITGCVVGGTADQVARCTPNTVYRQFAIVGINLNSSPLDNLPILSLTQISSIASALGLSPNPFVGATVTGHDENFKNPMAFQYGFAIERELMRNFIVGADFAHVKTTRVQRNRDLNLPSPLTAAQYVAFLQANNTTANYNTMVANGTIDAILNSGRTFIAVNTPVGLTFPSGSVTTRQRPTNDPLLNPNAANRLALGPVQVRESSAKAMYDALTLRARVVKKWGQLNAYYTLSKNLTDDDNERDAGGVAFADPYNLTREYGPSRLDRRHQFVANPVFFLPWDFEISSAIRLLSGTPLNATVGGDLNGDTVNNDRPLLAPGLTYKRNAFRNRRIDTVDLRVQKGFKFDEQRRLIFTAEFFNVFNSSNIIFPTPNTATSSGLTGQFCSSASQTCGLLGPTNLNFRQIRDQIPTSSTFGQILVNNVNPGSQVFQMQLGARFQF
jgi:hypothetical protein